MLSDPLPSPGILFSLPSPAGLPWEALASSGKGPKEYILALAICRACFILSPIGGEGV